MIAIQVANPGYTNKLSTVDPLDYGGYIIRPKDKEPILTLGEFRMSKVTINVEEPEPRTGEFVISDIPLKITLEAVVKHFEDKFAVRVITPRLGTTEATKIKNGMRILESEKEQLKTIQIIYLMHGVIAKNWHQ
ncbi:hypothetical protein ACJMK2_034132 [Sinanodonta woodiana]|uniref:Uncharacterized protein n=1 Tax=Sinanodonta woodiana TaxID=1069815 RepID=A0ABD3WUT6_SINWO